MSESSVESIDDDELELSAASHLVLAGKFPYGLIAQLSPEVKALVRSALDRIEALEKEVEDLTDEVSRFEGGGSEVGENAAARQAAQRRRDRTRRQRVEELAAENKRLKESSHALRQEVRTRTGQAERLAAKVDDLQEQIRDLIMPKIRRMYKDIA